MTFKLEAFADEHYPQQAATRIGASLTGKRSIVITGGTTAEKIYPPLAEAGERWAGTDVFFSDERCVPPDDDASNFGMASRLLLDEVMAGAVHRMRGEDPPDDAAQAYGGEVAPFVQEGLDLVLLGMGGDCHIAAMFPGSPVLQETAALCRAVDRPDGMKGLTLTPPSILSAGEILLLVTGKTKSEAVRRVTTGDEDAHACPARLLADHPNVTLLLDETAASLL